MFYQFIYLFLSLSLFIFNGFFSASALGSGCYLYRFEKDEESGNNELLLQYTDEIRSTDCKYYLNYDVDRELCNEVDDYGVADKHSRPKAASHILANGFDIYQKGKSVVNEYEHFTTRTFSNIGKQDTNIKIDWTSNSSPLEDDETIIRKKGGSGDGHSEPQLIKDINALWKTQQDSILKLFIPRRNTLKDSAEIKVMMCGLELYGNYDVCNSCLNKLVEFRKQHQQGQTSISQAIQDRLKDKCTDISQDRFVVIYHAYSSYSGSTYYTRYNDTEYKLTQSRLCIYNRNKEKDFRHEGFKLTQGQQDNGLSEAILSQSEFVTIRKDIIYGHIHSLSNKQAKYEKSYSQIRENPEQFVFRRKEESS
ncbi:hypothetical protein [Candidatus Paracaedibacter symbiosus]|uniref:hypothetical protein n=1 Tax=Candidatus Paracaedibacter symbiosus TaxID=244582 RepID=UPI000509A8D9|nr:hypothetical protein [Candidatus Paracaedibacter symbiosus]